MSRHLVRSFILATVLSPLVNAGPCRPPQISVSSVVESLTQSASLPSITSSSVLTETGLYSDTASEDTSTATFSTHDEPDYETATTSALSIVVILTTSETISSLAVSTDTYTAFSETETLTATTNDHLPTTMTDTSSTTSEPEPEPSCKDGFKNPLPEHTVCNLKGGATGDLTKIADGPGLVDGVEECRAACKELDGCDSFVLFSGQPCALFSGRPDFVSVVSSSSVTWFDMNCFCEEETTVPEPQPEPESSCKNSLKNPLPDAKICGKKGTATGGVQSLSTGDRGSLETCFKSCKNNPQCESVVWKQDLLCTLWSGRPLDVQASQADSEWYDIDCFCEQEIKEDEPSCKRSEDAVCGITGDALPTMQYYGEGPKDSLIKCADACSANDSCGFFMFEDKISCDMYTGVLSRTNGRVTYQKWYDATCFCGEEVRPLG